MSYIFGGDTGMSYDDIQRKRKIAEQMLMANATTPRNVGEGIGAIGRALAARAIEKRTGKRMGELEEEANEVWSNIFGGVGQQPQTYAAPVPAVETRTEGDKIGSDVISALNDVRGSKDMEPLINPEDRLLLARTLQAEAGSEGVPGMIAAGAVVDNRRKSGKFGEDWRDVVMAPGQFSAWNSVTGYAGGEQGQPMNFQPSPEALEAADAILTGNYQDPTGGATHYFNPAISQPKWAQGKEWTPIGRHVFGTADAPGSGGPAGVGGMPRNMPNRIANMQGIIEAMNNPIIARDKGKMAVLNALLGQAMAPPPEPPGPTALQQNVEWLVSQGIPFQDAVEMVRGGTRVDVHTGDAPAPMIGTIPQNYSVVEDPSDPSGYRMVPIGGSEAQREIEENKVKQERKEEQQQLKLGTSLTSLDLNIQEIENGGLPVTGPLGDLRRTALGRTLTGSSAFDFGNRTSQITDSAAFAEIQNMRDNSPTGGAVGQLTDKEREAIGNAVTALNSSTSAEEYLRAAKAYKELALNLAYGEGTWELDENGKPRTKGTAAEDDGVPVWNPEKGVWE